MTSDLLLLALKHITGSLSPAVRIRKKSLWLLSEMWLISGHEERDHSRVGLTVTVLLLQCVRAFLLCLHISSRSVITAAFDHHHLSLISTPSPFLCVGSIIRCQRSWCDSFQCHRLLFNPDHWCNLCCTWSTRIHVQSFGLFFLRWDKIFYV